MTVDSMGDPLRTAKCHACGLRGSGQGDCTRCGTSFSKRLEAGTVLGSYRLEEVIGEGGMGIVYSAIHTRLGRRVAIKMLRSHYTTNRQAIQRFFAEARAVNKIAHPNIVEVTDFIEQVGDDNYYVMELLQGMTLANVQEQCGILPLPRTIGIMIQVASVLEAVHAAGIVHRDLKPDNVFLIERSGQKDFVKLVDFGVAKLLDDNDDFVSTHNTNPGSIVGTPDYMSPEQASAAAVDHRTDIYAFGAVLYKLVTGRLPLTGANFGEIVVQLLTVPPTPPRELPDLPHEVPESLQELILSCLAKETINRPDSMETVSERLGEIAEEQGWIVYELNVKASGPMPAARRPSSSLPPLTPKRRAETQPPAAEPRKEAPARKQPSVDIVQWPAPEPKPVQRRGWPLAAIGATAVALLLVGVIALRGRGSDASGDVHAKVREQLAIADQRIAEGRLVATGGDDALEHLLAARKLEPKNTDVQSRLHALAGTYERLANDARAAGSLPEAAAHLQVVLSVEPDNAEAAQEMKAIETQMLARERPQSPH